MKGGARPGAGRKKGSGQAAHYRAMLEPYAEELIQQVVDRAKDGDMAALKLCLDRLCAPLRPSYLLILLGVVGNYYWMAREWIGPGGRLALPICYIKKRRHSFTFIPAKWSLENG